MKYEQIKSNAVLLMVALYTGLYTHADENLINKAPSSAGAGGDAQASDAMFRPLPFGHAHNDYSHKRPLLDALDHGFGSIEADIFLVEGELLVAHHPREFKPERTLAALYLDPLLKRVKANGGSVYVNGPPVTLLIDIKSDPETTYRALLNILKPYQEMLTTLYKDKTEMNAVTVIISGRSPRALMESEAVRIAGFEGRVPDLNRSDSSHFMPLISDRWRKHFKWKGNGPMPEEERSKLKALVAKAHEQGKRIRFWDTPNDPVMWTELLNAGVDLINVDALTKFKEFSLANNIRDCNQKPRKTLAPKP